MYSASSKLSGVKKTKGEGYRFISISDQPTHLLVKQHKNLAHL